MSKYGDMRKSNLKQRGGKKRKESKVYNGLATIEIRCSEHVLHRYRERSNKPGLEDEGVKKRIVGMVRRSTLICMDGKKEMRSCGGRIFVCARTYHDGKETMVIITELLSENVQKEMMRGRLSDFVSIAEKKQQKQGV